MKAGRYILNAIFAAVPVLGVMGVAEPFFLNLTLTLSVFVALGALAVFVDTDADDRPGVAWWHGVLTLLIPAVALCGAGWFWCGSSWIALYLATEINRERLTKKKKRSGVAK